MRTITIEVGGLLSALSTRGVEKQLAKLPGVQPTGDNYVAGSATVVYDETVTDVDVIKAKVHKCGYHCSGELVPRHLRKPANPPSKGKRRYHQRHRNRRKVGVRAERVEGFVGT